jgi:hypothetical protein
MNKKMTQRILGILIIIFLIYAVLYFILNGAASNA